ncbi:MAG TPA: hypothetical protein VK835_09895 [Bacteroidia bacterium]|jgi:hypothetical protein|nr:hypothetical protein [Bacteroidia bacterium]
MKSNAYVQQVINLSESVDDRIQFHNEAGKLLVKMGQDKSFWFEVFKTNLSDKGFLQRKWTMYEIPFFYIYENNDFYIKAHLFVPLKTYEPHVVTSAIHHHNNYILSSYAAYGSGYEAMLFEKNIEIDPTTKEVKLKIKEHFTQADKPLHIVDAWEPHVVINPISLSATLVLWSPDKKRNTDALRSNPILKAIKTPLRKLIYALGLDKKIGIAAKDTYQFYVTDNKFYAVLEEDYFAPTRQQDGENVNDYSVQTLFAFMQRMGFSDHDFLKLLKANNDVPRYYHKWIDMLLSNQPIPDTYAKEVINVPNGRMMVKDILNANKI